MAFSTVYFAKKANINVATVTVIWSSNPLFLAMLDYVLFKNKLMPRHMIGICCLVACAFMISISGVIYPPS